MISISLDFGDAELELRIEASNPVPQPLVEIKTRSLRFPEGIGVAEPTRFIMGGVGAKVETVAQAAEAQETTMGIAQTARKARVLILGGLVYEERSAEFVCNDNRGVRVRLLSARLPCEVRCQGGIGADTPLAADLNVQHLEGAICLAERTCVGKARAQITVERFGRIGAVAQAGRVTDRV